MRPRRLGGWKGNPYRIIRATQVFCVFSNRYGCCVRASGQDAVRLPQSIASSFESTRSSQRIRASSDDRALSWANSKSIER